MDYPKRKHPRLKEYDYSQNGAYFITICVKNRENILGSISLDHDYMAMDEADLGMRQVKLSRSGQICADLFAEMQRVYSDVQFDAYVVMPNHVHMILMLENGVRTVPGVVRAYKALATRRIGHAIWQDSFYEHIIRNERDMAEIREYIQQNPMKWELDKFYQV